MSGLLLPFFEQRIFGPMRLDKLAKQLRAHVVINVATASSSAPDPPADR